jgi:hypothetical protein
MKSLNSDVGDTCKYGRPDKFIPLLQLGVSVCYWRLGQPIVILNSSP